ncbi:hypothetical protein AB1Y20_010388 [Prymnesium parvum]|uniref:EF-hand domain-containing protein n=1 Tax=Prymnesium parvum TaxID=97485 RepID=A0AB34IRC2_PRYPA
MVISLIPAAIGLFLLSPPLPSPPAPHHRTATRRHCVLTMAAEESGGELIGPSDLSKLQARIARIQQSGGQVASPAQKLFELATQKPPSSILREFVATSSPQVQQAMQDAISSMLGALPPFEFDSQITTTGDKLAALMLQLQMTGYMLRNAEYVVTLRKILGLRTRSVAEYRKAFEKLDLDDSGYIETTEVKALLHEVYGETPPAYEVESMMQLFDTNADGRIEWEEFATALGADLTTEGKPAPLDLLLPASSDADAIPTPPLEGKVRVQMEDGSQVEIDAKDYMEELKAEAQALRRELTKLQSEEFKREAAISQSLSAYVASLPEKQLKTLTSTISEDVVGAMRLVVEYILKAPSGDRPLGKDESVTLEQERLQQLCLYQLVLGYNLREKEAKGDAQDIIGR